MLSNASIYAKIETPNLQVADARGMEVRTVQLHRRDVGDPVETRVTAQRFDALGRLVASRDPYLFDLAKTDPLTPFNLTQVTSLSGVALLADSVDAGWRSVLSGGAGQVIEHWDGRGSHSLTEYDELLRPVAIRESGEDIAEHTLERFTYAGTGTDAIAHNLCGQLIRHDDPAGTVRTYDIGLSGNVLKRTRRFLLLTDPPDWPVSITERDVLLETGDGASTSLTFAPTTEMLLQTDAMGNRQAFAYSVVGQLKSARLTLAGEGQVEKLLVSNIHYNVIGQIESETAGNGVITRHHHDAANGRLIELRAHKDNGTPLHILKYRYDAVGNVLSIEDAAQPIRYFNNQRIEPIKTYRYDTLYQLIEATGCEAKTGQSGPALPDFYTLPTDPSQIANYTQTFHYDAAGNLLDLVHLGAQAHGRALTRARYSNRCLPERDNRPPTEEELAKGFDANGNLRGLQAGQPLSWNLRNQLSAVQLIVRKNAEAERECYIYDGGGQRVRKVNVSQGNARTLTREVRYLPGLEIRINSKPDETLHVITVSAGSNNVQVLHWVAERPDEVPQDQVRYSLNDHLKSCGLELDQLANLISQEWYYPFGGTAYWAGRNAIEAKYKTVCYSGKERDATGLYYYGFRYYAPWLQRWINPDPAGYVDGVNLFSMVGNSPASYSDALGLCRKPKTLGQIISFFSISHKQAASREDTANFNAYRKIAYRRQAIGTYEGVTDNKKTFNPADFKLAKPLRLVKAEAREDIKAMRERTFRDLHLERHSYEITINNGLLYHNDQLLNTSERGRFKFIQDQDGKLFGVETEDDPEGVKHSSLMGEHWPISAGTISATNGEIKNISNSSGHFRPTNQHLELTVLFLQSEGVSIEHQSPYFGKDRSKRLNDASPGDFRRRYGNLSTDTPDKNRVVISTANFFRSFLNRISHLRS